MLAQRVKQLDSNARLLLQQAIMNPSLQQVFMLEKIANQKLLLDIFRVDDETDAQFLRKIEILRSKIVFIDEILAFFNSEKSQQL